MAQWLEYWTFNPATRVQIPSESIHFFSLICYALLFVTREVLRPITPTLRIGYRFISNLRQVDDSLAQWLETFKPTPRGSNPTTVKAEHDACILFHNYHLLKYSS